jgi:hypothetical protein
MDFTDPASMNLILNDLAGEYMIKTDDVAADALVAGKTASGSTWTVTAADPTSLIDSLYDAAREIAEDSNYFPTHLCVSPDVWEKLGSQLDASKRPVLGYVTDGVMGQNSLGKVGGMGYNNMNVMGLQLVVDNNFASGTMLVCYAPGLKSTNPNKDSSQCRISGVLLVTSVTTATLRHSLQSHRSFRASSSPSRMAKNTP